MASKDLELRLTCFLTLTEVFPYFFFSCKANARVKFAKTGHGPHSSILVVICVVLLLFVLFYVLFLCKCVLFYCHRITTQLQLTNIACRYISYPYVCCLLV
jgi:magnesium-transporting ATPase (P-type)